MGLGSMMKRMLLVLPAALMITATVIWVLGALAPEQEAEAPAEDLAALTDSSDLAPDAGSSEAAEGAGDVSVLRAPGGGDGFGDGLSADLGPVAVLPQDAPPQPGTLPARSGPRIGAPAGPLTLSERPPSATLPSAPAPSAPSNPGLTGAPQPGPAGAQTLAPVAPQPQDTPSTAAMVLANAGQDPEMVTAVEAARAQLDVFFDLAANPDPQTSDFALRVAVRSGAQIEHLWMEACERRGSGLVSCVNVTDAQTADLKAGDRYTFSPNDITDWRYARDGLIHGAYTTRVALARMPVRNKDQIQAGFAPLTE